MGAFHSSLNERQLPGHTGYSRNGRHWGARRKVPYRLTSLTLRSLIFFITVFDRAMDTANKILQLGAGLLVLLF